MNERLVTILASTGSRGDRPATVALSAVSLRPRHAAAGLQDPEETRSQDDQVTFAPALSDEGREGGLVSAHCAIRVLWWRVLSRTAGHPTPPNLLSFLARLRAAVCHTGHDVESATKLSLGCHFERH